LPGAASAGVAPWVSASIMSSAVATPEPGMMKMPAKPSARPLAPVSAFISAFGSA
jgi:hypothetical protein